LDWVAAPVGPVARTCTSKFVWKVYLTIHLPTYPSHKRWPISGIVDEADCPGSYLRL
jgi:hypothetical protein